MDEANHEKATDSQGITVNSLESLSFKSVMENSGQSWGIKDKESRFVYMNKVSLDAHNLPIGFDIEGRLDEECPALGPSLPQNSESMIERLKKTEKMLL
ncbi:hypothetical protein [Candidatus Fukatsuia symbiotica]|uniref:hypothetical protein n=1 Tax=Candidatus Fukatsuia symbiotica TaxID=1878942 RepID=UPI001F07F6DF|nr:hypothetical protein [Candidatus Fukatsuia symbiotica]